MFLMRSGRRGPRRSALALALTLLLACAAAAAQAADVQITDNFTKTPVALNSTDNLGQGAAGAINQRSFSVTDLVGTDLDLQNCTITAPWYLVGLPVLGDDPVTIMPGLNMPFAVDIANQTYGRYSATVTCEGSGGFTYGVTWLLLNTAATIGLSANGNVMGQNGSFAFPTTLAGTTAPQTFTITNWGQAALTLSGVTVKGSGFSLGGSPAASIAAGAQASFTVNFAPTAGTPFSGTLTINSNDGTGNATLKINLSGNGTAATPAIQISDLSNGGFSVNPGQAVNYGNVPVGTSAAHTFKVANPGNVPLIISNGSSLLSGAGYSLTTPLPASIAAGAFADFTVGFLESAAGTYPGQVSILSNASPSPFTFPLTATVPSGPSGVTVVAPDGGLLGNGATYSLTGTIGYAQTPSFYIRNLSTTSSVTIGAVTVTGDSSFLLSSGQWGVLFANSADQETITFTPASTAGVSAALNFTVNGTPWTIHLVGEGVPGVPSMLLSWNATGASIQNGRTYSFSSTTPGTPVSAVFNIISIGSAALNLTSVTISSPNDCFTLIGTPPASSIAPGAATSDRIRIFATTAQSCTGTVTILSNDGATPTFTFSLTGTVTAAPYSLSIVGGDGTTVQPGGTYSGFPATTAGAAVSRAFSITNNGTATITISNASSILTSSGAFSVLTPPPATIAGGGGTGNFRIRLLANAAGTYTGTVTIDGDPAGPFTFTIVGTVN